MGILGLVFQIEPVAFFLLTPSYINLSFAHYPDIVTGHSHLLHTLYVIVDKRGLTFCENILLSSTHSHVGISLTVCNSMRILPIHLLLLAYSARRSPLIYPANRIWLNGQWQHIQSYDIGSDASSLWYWASTI